MRLESATGPERPSLTQEPHSSPPRRSLRRGLPRRGRWDAVAAVALGLIAFAVALTAQQTYKARLHALPATAKTLPDLAGVGSATATLSGMKLTVNGTFEGLKSNATMAELRDGGVAGVRGPMIGSLTITKAMKGSISGSVDLTAQQVGHLKKGGIYLQIDSEKPTDGTLWGWLGERP